jgi:hypothetical protein
MPEWNPMKLNEEKEHANESPDRAVQADRRPVPLLGC